MIRSPAAVAKTIALALLRAYRAALSPMLGPSCRFEPTCSVYASQAIERFGVVRGTFLALRRILRCHPFARGGLDPVPPGHPSAKQLSHS